MLKPRDRLWIYYLQGRVSREAFADDPGFDGKRWFILSGLLRSQAREVLAVLRHKGARLIKIWDEDGAWFTILGRN